MNRLQLGIWLSLLVVLVSQTTLAGEYEVKQLQRRLTDAGHDIGDVDGVIGERSITALKEYQQAHNLIVTGELDAATKKALDIKSRIPMIGDVPVLKLTAGDDSRSVLFVGDGKVFKGGKLMPLMLHWTNSDGNLMGLGAFMSPFVRINPAVLDCADLKFDDYLISTQHNDALGTELVGFVNTRKYQWFYITDNYTVYPRDGAQALDKWVDEQKERIPSSRGFVTVYIDVEAGKLTGARFDEGSILRVENQQDGGNLIRLEERETIILEVSLPGNPSAEYRFFPQFIGAEKGVITYHIRAK